MLRILLVEDDERQIDAAKRQLVHGSVELTIARSHDEAWGFLRTSQAGSTPGFDVVLTDVMLPKGGDLMMNPQGLAIAEQQGLVPYGPIIALHALGVGIKKIGMLTMEGNRHQHPIAFAMQFPDLKIGDVSVISEITCSELVDTETWEPRDFDRWALESGKIIRIKRWDRLLQKLLNN